MKKTVRLISLILALMMCFTVLPSAFAEADETSSEPEPSIAETEKEPEKAPESKPEPESAAVVQDKTEPEKAKEEEIPAVPEESDPLPSSSIRDDVSGKGEDAPSEGAVSEENDGEYPFEPIPENGETPSEETVEGSGDVPFIPCTLTEGCTLEDGHDGECVPVSENEAAPDEKPFIPCSLTEGCILGDGHEGECMFPEETGTDFVPCVLTEGCILENGHEGECVLAETESVLAFGFPGMPAGFVLSKEQFKQKQDIVDHKIVQTLSETAAGQSYVKRELLLITNSESFAKTVAEAYDATLIFFNGHFAKLRLNEATVLEAVTVAADLSNNMPAVTPNYIRRIEPIRRGALTGGEQAEIAVPKSDSWKDYKDNDDFLSDPTNTYYQWHHDMVNSYEAWTDAKGNGVKVAVIDSGVDNSHPDLKRVTVKQVLDLPTGAGGKHGTHVAGIIAAALGNHEGGSGIAPNVSVYSYRISDSAGKITTDAEVQAIYSAADAGVDIINLSIGGAVYEPVENAAVQYAYRKGVTIVAAMGNAGTNSMNYPAAYDHVIAVGAVTPSGTRAYFSNYGSWCDVSAPGISILSTTPGGTYDFLDGTSQATPIVTGVLALYMSRVGHVSPDAALKKLKSSVNKCTSSGMGAGIVDASKLFSTDKTVPVMAVKVGGTPFANLKTAVPYDAKLFIEPGELSTNSALILYTTNGKSPALKNGEVVEGIEYTEPISLSSFSGKKVTIKAACVNSYGVLGRIATISLTVSKNPSPDSVSIRLSGRPADSLEPVLAAGKALNFTAAVLPSDSSQNVTWSVTDPEGTSPKVKINAKGKLTSTASDSGYVLVTARSTVRSDVSATVTVRISPILPVSVIKLNTTSVALSRPGQKQLEILTLTDTKKNDVRESPDHLLSWSSSAPSVASVDQNGLVTAEGPGTAKITCTVLDGSGKKAVCTVKVSQSVESIEIAGTNYLARGKSFTFKAVTAPANATKKTVIWSCSENTGASIDKNGKLTVSSDAAGSVTVRAEAADGSGVCSEHLVNIVSAGTFLRLDRTGTVKLIPFDPLESAPESMPPHTMKLTAATNSPLEPVWSSSNEKIAAIDSSGNVTGISNGTATITCKIPDGSGLKASVKVSVGTPASSLRIESSIPSLSYYTIDGDDNDNLEHALAYGKTASHTLTFGDSFGKPTAGTSDVEWIVDVTGSQTVSSAVRSAIQWSDKGAKLTIKKTPDLVRYINNHCLYISIQAHTTDGTDLYSNVLEYEIVPPTTYAKAGVSTFLCFVSEDVRLYPYSASFFNQGYDDEYDYFYTLAGFATDCWYLDFDVSSSNPSVVNFSSAFFDDDGDLCYSFICAKPGKSSITFKAKDGTGKSIKFNVTVK